MAYSSDITQHPEFSSFVKVNKFYLRCIVQNEQGEMLNETELASKFTKVAAITFNTINSLPAMGSILSSNDLPEAIKIVFIGYGTFGQDVLVTIGGPLT